MASLYERNGSPFYWLKFRGTDGSIKQVSTRCRIGIAPELRRARQMKAEKDLAELSGPGASRESGWAWVTGYLRVKYATTPSTLERYDDCWRSLKMFLDELEIDGPQRLTRQHCFDYMDWRGKSDLSLGKYRAGRNTAILDLKILRILMNEAVIRGYCIGNPCVSLDLKRARPKKKAVFTADDLAFIRDKIAAISDPDDRELFSNSFEIARYQGCRMNETHLNPLTDVDLPRQTITLRLKGGEDYTTALHPALIPLFEKLKAAQRTETWKRPANAPRQWASRKWCRFLRRSGIKARIANGSFHSTRWTAITEMTLAGVPEDLRQRYLGQRSTKVHRGYQQITPSDLAGHLKAIV